MPNQDTVQQHFSFTILTRLGLKRLPSLRWFQAGTHGILF